MPMIAFSPNTRIRSADVNANFTNSLALDTPRIVIVTHTWNARQNFAQGIQVVGASTFAGPTTFNGPTEFDDDVTVIGAFRVTGGIAATATISGARFRADDGAANSVAFGFASGDGFYRSSGGRGVYAISGEPQFGIGLTTIEALGANVFKGNGSGLTNLPAASLTGNINPARLTSVPAGSLTGTVSNARLPNTISQTDITASDLLQGLRLHIGGTGGSVVTWISFRAMVVNPSTPVGTTRWNATASWPGLQVGDLVLVSNPWATWVGNRQFVTSAEPGPAGQINIYLQGNPGSAPDPLEVKMFAIRFA